MSEEAKKNENKEKVEEAKVEEQTEVKTEVAEKPVEAVEKEAKPEVEKKPKVQLSENMENLIKSVEEMSVLELSELVKALEDRFGVSAAAPMAMAGPGAAGAVGGAVEVEEKTIFDVILTDIGSQKIQVIKEIRALTSLGLKEAKDLVEAAPKEVKTGVAKEEAEKMKKQLEAVGAKVELK